MLLEPELPPCGWRCPHRHPALMRPFGNVVICNLVMLAESMACRRKRESIMVGLTHLIPNWYKSVEVNAYPYISGKLIYLQEAWFVRVKRPTANMCEHVLWERV